MSTDGFRKNRSTTDVLTILENIIAEATKKRQSTAMVSLDISKAYDMCWRYNILKKIKNWKIDRKLLHFINEFMKNRTHGIEIIGYADDWIIHTTHKHEQVSVVKLQKAKAISTKALSNQPK
jgi:hypothetical protein